MSSPSNNPNELMVDYFANLEKKQRNLIKRKVKLDSYKEMLKKGRSLSSDQERAVAEYEQVCQNITFLKETGDILENIQLKLDSTIKAAEQKRTAVLENYAVDVLRRLSPILDLLSKIQSPLVKAAVIKATSPQQYQQLDNISKRSIIPLPAIDELENESSHASNVSAMSLLKLANADPSPINGKSKAPSYSDIRQLCFTLVGDELVRAALSSPFAEIPKKKHSLPVSDSKVTDASYGSLERTHKSTTIEASAPKVERTMPPQNILPAEVILNNVINPLKTNFNFLQASRVCPVPIVPATHAAIQQPNQPIQSNQNQSTQPRLQVKQEPIEVVVVNEPRSIKENDCVIPQRPTSTTDDKVQIMTIRRSSESKGTGQRDPNDVPQHEAMNQGLYQQKRPNGPKSWADRARGFTVTPSVEHAVDMVSQEPQNYENGHGGPHKGRSQSSRQADEGSARTNGRPGTAAVPRSGGFRGGRGRGGTGQYRGGRGRGHPRGSYHMRNEFNSADAVQSNMPIQSMC